ncbi:MAG: hypothetical protein EBV18_03740, partial [Proteobacteria bacterium]|nr:hypothetical protein [Candidatus Fonsibacter lacus]
FLWLILVAWLTDIGGYIFGKIFGGPKLIKISPNKTWSGAFGSLFLSQFAFLIYYLDPNFKVNTNIANNDIKNLFLKLLTNSSKFSFYQTIIFYNFFKIARVKVWPVFI